MCHWVTLAATTPGNNAPPAKEKFKTRPFWLRQPFQNKSGLGELTPKSVKHVSEGGRVGKKEGTDAKQLRPKADQAVSSVSAAPALVDDIRYCRCSGRTELASWLWSISPASCFVGELTICDTRRSRASVPSKSVHCTFVPWYGHEAWRPDRVTCIILLMPTPLVVWRGIA